MRNKKKCSINKDASLITWEVPWIKLVDVQLPDELNRDGLLLDLLLEVETNQLFIGRMEPEPRHEDLI